jgi:hypothetical protein
VGRALPIPLSAATLAHDFNGDLRTFMLRFGWSGIHAATAWGLSVPVILTGVFFPLHRAFRHLAPSL